MPGTLDLRFCVSSIFPAIVAFHGSRREAARLSPSAGQSRWTEGRGCGSTVRGEAVGLLADQAPSTPAGLQPPPPPRSLRTAATAVRATEGDSPVAHSTEGDLLCLL